MATAHEHQENTVLDDPSLDDELKQKTPNSYNTRNIMIVVLMGLALIGGGFFLSLGGSDDEQGRLQVSEEARTIPQEARPPDPREHREARETDPGQQNNDPFAGGMSQEELDALLGGQSGQEALAGELPPLETRSEYELQRQLAFQQTLGLPTRSNIRPLPGPATGRSEDPGQSSRRQDSLDGADEETHLPAPAFFEGPSSTAQQDSYEEASALPAVQEGPPARARQEGPRIAVQGPFPPYTIAKGTLVPIVLESSVNSDVGGMIIARTTTDVYDRTRQHILIPRGSEIISDYGSAAAVGQNRLDVAASRLNLPDGRYVDFEDAAAYDPTGRVDRHLLGKFGSIAVLSLTGVAVSVASGNTRGSDVIVFEGSDGRTVEIPIDNVYRSPEDIAAQHIIGEINRVISKEMDRVLNRPNTIKLRSGLRGVLILGDDVDMVRPYYEGNLEPDPFGYSPLDVRPGYAPQVPPPPLVPTGPSTRPTTSPLVTFGNRP